MKIFKIILKITLIISLLVNSAGQGYLCPEALAKGYALRSMATSTSVENKKEALIIRCSQLNDIIFPLKRIFEPLEGTRLSDEFLIEPPPRHRSIARVIYPPMLYRDPFENRLIAFLGPAQWGYSILLPVGDNIDIFTKDSDQCPLIIMLL